MHKCKKCKRTFLVQTSRQGDMIISHCPNCGSLSWNTVSEVYAPDESLRELKPGYQFFGRWPATPEVA